VTKHGKQQKRRSKKCQDLHPKKILFFCMMKRICYKGAARTTRKNCLDEKCKLLSCTTVDFLYLAWCNCPCNEIYPISCNHIMNLSNHSFQFLVLQPLMLIKQLEFILSEKWTLNRLWIMPPASWTIFFIRIWKEWIGFVGPLPENLLRLMEKVEEKFPAGVF